MAKQGGGAIYFSTGKILLILCSFVTLMKLLLRDISIGKWKIPVPVFLWFFLAMLAAIAEISRGPLDINNYYILCHQAALFHAPATAYYFTDRFD
jgi:hypothetical protein